MAEELSWEPGWFSDPTGRHDHRWWDGAAWTAHVADAGVAAHDPLDAPAADVGPAPGRVAATGAAAAGAGTDPIAVISLVVSLVALPLALVPVLGLIPAVAAVALAVIARSRVRSSGRGGGGLATAGSVLSIGALVLAGLITVVVVAILGGSGGELTQALRDYAACLEVDTQAECRLLLEQSVARMLG